MRGFAELFADDRLLTSTDALFRVCVPARRPRRGAGSALSNWRTRSEQRRSGRPRPHCGLLYLPGVDSLGALEQCSTHALPPARRLVASRSTRFLQCRVEGSRWRFRRSGRTPRLALSALSDGIVRSISLALRRPLDGCADGLDEAREGRRAKVSGCKIGRIGARAQWLVKRSTSASRATAL